MDTRYTRQDYRMDATGPHVLGRQQARRRRLLGITLIVVGSIWFFLRLIGWVGDLPSPMGWVEGTAIMVKRLNPGGLALTMPLMACAMLATYAFRGRR